MTYTTISTDLSEFFFSGLEKYYYSYLYGMAYLLGGGDWGRFGSGDGSSDGDGGSNGDHIEESGNGYGSGDLNEVLCGTRASCERQAALEE
jgi:hypothetical protein